MHFGEILTPKKFLVAAVFTILMYKTELLAVLTL